MKPIAISLASVALAVVGAPALAGLDFTDRATNGGGTADFSFNGSTTIGTFVSMNNGFGGATNATISSTNAANSVTPSVGNVVFSYTGAFNPSAVYDWTGNPGNPAYNMVIEFGAITLGAGASALLQSVEFDEGSGFTTLWNVNQAIATSTAFTRVHLNVPNGVIPTTQRDAVQRVRLQFSFNGGSATSINVRAVVNPEPGTIALFGLGLVGLAGAVRARRKARAAAKLSS